MKLLSKIFPLRCPQCAQRDIRRSALQQRREWLLFVVGMRPYRCQPCDTRFYRLAVK